MALKTSPLPKTTRAVLVDHYYRANPGLVAAETARIRGRHAHLTHAMDAYWAAPKYDDRKAACVAHMFDKWAPEFTDEALTARLSYRMRAGFRTALDTHFSALSCRIEAGAAAAAGIIASYSKGSPERLFLDGISRSPFHRFLQWHWTQSVRHPYTVNTITALISYAVVETLGQMLKFGGIADGGRIIFLSLFSFYQAWEGEVLINLVNRIPISSSEIDPTNEQRRSVIGKPVATLWRQAANGIGAIVKGSIREGWRTLKEAAAGIWRRRAGELKRLCMRLFVIAPLWTIRHVAGLAIGSDLGGGGPFRLGDVLEKSAAVYPGSLALAPVEYMIHNRSRRQYRYLLVMTRGTLWSIWNTIITLP